jgi:hypothetical protein
VAEADEDAFDLPELDAAFEATSSDGEIEDLEEPEPVWADLTSSDVVPTGMTDPDPESRTRFVPSVIFEEQRPTLGIDRSMNAFEQDAPISNPLFDTDTAPVEAVDSSGTVGNDNDAPIYPAVGSRLTGLAGSILRTELQNILQRGIGNRSSLNAVDLQNVFGMASLAAANIMREQGRPLSVGELVQSFAGLEGLPNRVPDSAIDAGLLELMGPGGPTGNFFDFAVDGALGIEQFTDIVNEALMMAGRTETPQRVAQLFRELAGDGGTFGRNTVLDGIGAMEVWPGVFEDDGFFHLSTLGDLLAVQFDNLPRVGLPPVAPQPSRSMSSYSWRANSTVTGIVPNSNNLRVENERTAPRATFTDFLQFANTSYNLAGFGQPNVSTAFRAFNEISGIDGRPGYSWTDHNTAFPDRSNPFRIVQSIEAWGASPPPIRTSGGLGHPSWMWG